MRSKADRQVDVGVNHTDSEKLRATAFRMIARRALTRRELIIRLRRKGASENQAESIVDDFVKQGYINDRAIGEDFIRRGREERLVGRMLVKYELSQKGIDRELIERIIDEGYPETSEVDVACKFALRKQKQIRDVPAEKQLRRLAGSLKRRGFSGYSIETAMREISSDIH